MDWRIGKIDQLLCSKDGEVRSVEIVVIKNGNFKNVIEICE